MFFSSQNFKNVALSWDLHSSDIKSALPYYPCSPVLMFPPLWLPSQSFLNLHIAAVWLWCAWCDCLCNYPSWNSSVGCGLLSIFWNYFANTSSNVCFSVPFFLSSQKSLKSLCFHQFYTRFPPLLMS